MLQPKILDALAAPCTSHFSLSSLEPLFPISSFSCIFNLLSQEGWEKLCGASLPVLNVAVTEADNMARWRMIAMMGHIYLYIYIYIHMASHDDSTCLELQSASISCNLETGSHCCHHQQLHASNLCRCQRRLPRR